jgi:hypothetical protein
MTAWIRTGMVVAGGVAAGSVAALAAGTLRWHRTTARAVRRLAAQASSRDAAGAAVYSREELAGLPAPVVRYFEFALQPGQPLIRRARLEQQGVFRTRADAAWSPFTATEHFSVWPPAFVWDARIRMLPLLAVRVRDSYLGGEGWTRAAVAGLVSVADQHGTPEMASASLVRYLAEAVWLPTALLPGGGVSWAAVDDSTARATLADGTTTVSLDVHVGARGEIVRVATVRQRDVAGVPVPTPWVGHFGDYTQVGGMMIPRAGEVEWVLPEGAFSYWRGRCVRAAYEFAR